MSHVPDSITAKASPSSDYERPPEGQFQAVCVDIVNLGDVYSPQYNKVNQKCALVFQIDELNSKGQRYEVAKRFTVSMHKDSNLRKFLESWRGKKYSEEEAIEGAPLDKLYKHNALIQITHDTNPKTGKTYANINAIMAGVKGASIQPQEYTRHQSWSEEKARYAADLAKARGDTFDSADDGGSGLPKGVRQAVEEDDLPF